MLRPLNRRDLSCCSLQSFCSPSISLSVSPPSTPLCPSLFFPAFEVERSKTLAVCYPSFSRETWAALLLDPEERRHIFACLSLHVWRWGPEEKRGMVEELDVGEAKAERAPEVPPSFSSRVPARYEGSHLSSLAFGAPAF